MKAIKFRAFRKETKNFVYYDGENNGSWWGDCVLDCLERYEPLQQYIGLKDFKGREIYEGDILKMKTSRSPVEVIGGGCSTNKYGFICYGYEFPDYAENSEIIGNIYENPELVK
jgi:hypothetical protein